MKLLIIVMFGMFALIDILVFERTTQQVIFSSTTNITTFLLCYLLGEISNEYRRKDG